VRLRSLGRGEDQLIRRLLRAYMQQHSRAVPTESYTRRCSEFDPDLANAYIERVLTASECVRYEQHMADCDFCRKATAKLAQMASLESQPALKLARTRWAVCQTYQVSRLPQALITGLLSEPQWLVAIIVAVAFAIGALLFSRNQSFDQGDLRPTGQAPQRDPQPQLDIRTSKSSAARRVAAKPTGSAHLAKKLVEAHTVAEAKSITVLAKQQEASESKPVAAVPAPELTTTIAQAKEEVQPAPINLAVALRQQLAKIDAAQVADVAESSQFGMISLLAKPDKKKADKLHLLRVPLLLPSFIGSSLRRTLIGQASIFSISYFSEKSAAVAASAKVTPDKIAERQIGKKKFRFLSGIWTDEGYKPEKDKQVVLLVRGSDAYKTLLAKHSELKAYFASFAPSEFVIIVYKGAVYKLVPQGSNK
jgi:hypothetical protein